jgi:hypothetical protein
VSLVVDLSGVGVVVGLVGVGVGVVVDSASVGVVAGLSGVSMVGLDLGVKLRKKNDIVLYYNTKNNEIEYLYGQQNDIKVERIKYQIITNGRRR